MLIESADGQSTLELVSCDAEWSHFSSICFRALARSPEVRGTVDHAWFALADFERFVQDLRDLHQGTAEAARLESLSPEEFVFEAFPLNARGHVGVRYVLSGMRHAESTVFPFKLSAGFQMDPTLLLSVAAGLESELSRQKTSS